MVAVNRRRPLPVPRSAKWPGWRGRAASYAPLLLPEEPRRPDDQQTDQEHEAVEVLVGGRQEHRAQRLDEAEEHATDDRAQDRAETADDDDLEALEGRDRPALRIDEEVRSEQGAGRRGQRDADTERQHVEP